MLLDDIFALSLAPVIASMEILGFTLEEIRQLMARRSVLLRIMQSPNANEEIAAWLERGGSAEVIQLDDFRRRREERLRTGPSHG